MQLSQQPSRSLFTAKAAFTSIAVAVALSAYASHVSGADLAGTARDAQGRPRMGVVIQLTGADARTSSTVRQTTTTAAGQFAFTGIPPGPYDLLCSGGQPVRVDVAAGTNRRDCP